MSSKFLFLFVSYFWS